MTLPYRGNVALSFLNLGGGAHGAAFPVERQTDAGADSYSSSTWEPGLDDLNALVSRLPAERQAAWTTRVKRERSACVAPCGGLYGERVAVHCSRTEV